MNPPPPTSPDPDTGTAPPQLAERDWRFWVGGALVLASTVGVALLSREFRWGEGHLQRPILTFIWVYLIGWLGYGLAIATAGRRCGRVGFMAILGVGVAARLVLLPSQPVQESDFYRYIWDGQVALNGISPYATAPESLPLDRVTRSGGEAWEDASQVQARINHPEVKTIYPPLAQLVFAVNAWCFGWRANGMRYTLLAVDLVLALVVALTLRDLRWPATGLLVYLWCPLVLKEAINSMHLDLSAALALAIAIWALVRARPGWALAGIWVAAWIKLTPVALAPLLLAHLWQRGDRPSQRLAVGGGLAFTAASLAMLGLMTLGAEAPFAGLQAFSSEWEANAGAFSMLRGSLQTGGLGYAAAAATARGVVAALVGLAILGLAWRRSRSREALLGACQILLLLIWLLAPVGNPWYLLWLLPFLVLGRHPAVWLLMAATSLYYVEFHLIYREAEAGMYRLQRLVEYLPWALAAAYLAWRRPLGLFTMPPIGAPPGEPAGGDAVLTVSATAPPSPTAPSPPSAP